VAHPPDSTALALARWEAILATAFDAIISIDEHERITLFNRAAEAIFGYAAGEVVGQPVEMLMPSPYREEHRDYVRRYEETGIARAIGRIRKVEARRKSGEIFPIELSVSRAEVPDGVIYSAIIRDVSVQARLEEELRAYGRREAVLARLGLAALDENVPRLCLQASALIAEVLDVPTVLVLLVAGETRFVVRGSTGSRYRMGERVVIPSVPTDPQAALPESLAGDLLVSTLTVPIGRIREPAGLLVIGTRRPEVFPPDTVHFVQATSNVLAEAIGRQELMRRARQRERLADVGTLTAKVLHDLGNPLAGLSMTAQSILRRIERAPSDELATIRPGVERLVTTMRRLDTLLSEFKTFSREHHFELRAVPVRPFLTSALAVWEAEASQREIALALDTGTDELVMRGDVDQVHRVIDNVVKNALEAIGHGPGRIDVRIEARPDGRVAIVVRDSGPGFPADLEVFRLFATTKTDGTGLGLATCRQIVEAHGGRITAESPAGGGAVVTIELPQARP
jgi:PAS domain S-box-containing protein